MAAHLLSLATQYGVLINLNTMISFLKSFTALTKTSSDTTELSSLLLNYIKTMYTDINGEMLDVLKGKNTLM